MITAKPNGFFRVLYATFPWNFVKIGWVFLRNSAKIINWLMPMTTLPEVTTVFVTKWGHTATRQERRKQQQRASMSTVRKIQQGVTPTLLWSYYRAESTSTGIWNHLALQRWSQTILTQNRSHVRLSQVIMSAKVFLELSCGNKRDRQSPADPKLKSWMWVLKVDLCRWPKVIDSENLVQIHLQVFEVGLLISQTHRHTDSEDRITSVIM